MNENKNFRKTQALVLILKKDGKPIMEWQPSAMGSNWDDLEYVIKDIRGVLSGVLKRELIERGFKGGR